MPLSQLTNMSNVPSARSPATKSPCTRSQARRSLAEASAEPEPTSESTLPEELLNTPRDSPEVTAWNNSQRCDVSSNV